MVTGALTDMSSKEEKIGKFDKWEVNNWLDNLITAQEVLDDPKKKAAVKILMAKKSKAVDKVEDLLTKTGARLKETFGKK